MYFLCVCFYINLVYNGVMKAQVVLTQLSVFIFQDISCSVVDKIE